MSKLKKVVFDQSKWIKRQLTVEVLNGGEKPTITTSHCALGFYLSQLGIPDRETCDLGSPERLPLTQTNLQLLAEGGAEWLICPVRRDDGTIVNWKASEDAMRIMGENDGPRDEAGRLAGIREIFAKHGIEIDLESEH